MLVWNQIVRQNTSDINFLVDLPQQRPTSRCHELPKTSMQFLGAPAGNPIVQAKLLELSQS